MIKLLESVSFYLHAGG